MKRITTDDLLREAAEMRFVRRRELLSLLLDDLEHDKEARGRLARLMEGVAEHAKPEQKPDDMRGFAWLPTFEWEKDGDSLSLKVTDIEKVRFRWRVVDKDGKAYDATFGEGGVHLIPAGALDLPTEAPEALEEVAHPVGDE